MYRVSLIICPVIINFNDTENGKPFALTVYKPCISNIFLYSPSIRANLPQLNIFALLS